MIITKTPFRMSFFGGGTDLPGFFQQHGGAVLSTSFDKYCYVTVRHLPRFFEYRNLITYSKNEYANSAEEIHHPLIREGMKMLGIQEIRIIYDADLPAQSGIGTSSSFAVGLLNAFYALKGKYVDKKGLANDAIRLERELCAEEGGLQDQIAASFGGLNKIVFNQYGYEVHPIIISAARKEELEQSLMLFFTGYQRNSADVQRNTQRSIQKNENRLKDMCVLVDDAESILSSKQDLSSFGELLDKSWNLKRSLTNEISTDAIDDMYIRAMRAGALGGKLLGAGAGGFLLFYVPIGNQLAVLNALPELLHVPFKFEENGSRVIHFAPEPFTQEG